MIKVVVAYFKTEKKALAAVHKLNELNSYGDISLYDKIVVRKKQNGGYETLSNDCCKDWRALGVMVFGGLFGTLGRPLVFLTGLHAAKSSHSVQSAYYYDFAEVFLASIQNKMTAGAVSIIAEIDEEKHEFVDIYFRPFGAEVIKSGVDFYFDEDTTELLGEIENEIAVQRYGLKKAMGREKKKIETKVAALKVKRKVMMADYSGKENSFIRYPNITQTLEMQPEALNN